jgi:hypothetical protein
MVEASPKKEVPRTDWVGAVFVAQKFLGRRSKTTPDLFTKLENSNKRARRPVTLAPLTGFAPVRGSGVVFVLKEVRKCSSYDQTTPDPCVPLIVLS